MIKRVRSVVRVDLVLWAQQLRKTRCVLTEDTHRVICTDLSTVTSFKLCPLADNNVAVTWGSFSSGLFFCCLKRDDKDPNVIGHTQYSQYLYICFHLFFIPLPLFLLFQRQRTESICAKILDPQLKSNLALNQTVLCRHQDYHIRGSFQL